MARVLVACEYSGRVRDALRAVGINAVSCDLLPSEAPGPHFQADVLPLLRERWDMVLAFPPCTYLSNSGVRWLHERPGRWDDMQAGATFFLARLNANAPRVAVENPVQHGYARAIIGQGPDFTVQPFEHGDPFTKRTCFWTKGLPPLIPTEIVTERYAACHRASPGPNRWKERSRTYPGIARAIASQWGALL